MYCTLSTITDADLDTCLAHTDAQTANNTYATAPMPAIQPVYVPQTEELLHAQFENAISDRLTALHSRLDNLQHSRQAVRNTTSAQQAQRATKCTTYTGNRTWQHYSILGSMALSLLLIGFDLMGLMILYTH